MHKLFREKSTFTTSWKNHCSLSACISSKESKTKSKNFSHIKRFQHFWWALWKNFKSHIRVFLLHPFILDFKLMMVTRQILIKITYSLHQQNCTVFFKGSLSQCYFRSLNTKRMDPCQFYILCFKDHPSYSEQK